MRPAFAHIALTAFLLAGCASQSQSQHPLLSKRIFVADQNDQIINLHELRTAMRAYISRVPARIGVYFEYLPSGASIGINEEDRFIAASLLKVPLVIEAYAMKNNGQLQFTDKLTLRQEDLDSGFGELWKRGAGAAITVHDAVRAILMQSDNTARNALVRYMQEKNPNYLDDAFDDLDMPKELVGENPVVSAENYSSILKSLYLSSSLPKEDSSEILTLLTKTPFNDKLPAGVPPGTVVSHKIGVYDTDAELLTYSDCGIVYLPRRPFLLCVITQEEEQQAAQHIRELTRLAYDFISSASVTVH